MTVEKVLWTALPNGLGEDGRLRISVHVAPRLRNDDGSDTQRALGDFPTFLRWPDCINQLRFEVRFDGGPSAAGIPEASADTGLWELLFPDTMRVGPHVFQDHATRDMHTLPVRPLLRFLEDAYGAAGAAGTNLPSIDDPLGPLAPFGPLGTIPHRITDTESFYRELARAQDKAAGDRSDGVVVHDDVAASNLPAGAQTVLNACFEAYRFYYRPGSQRPDLPDDHIEPSPKPHDFEFHEVISGLADHPLLLRRLGLVIDLAIDADPADVPATGVVRVVPRGDVLPPVPPACPGTSYELDGKWFGARPQSEFQMTRGILRLSPEVFDLFQVDVDGAVLQAVDFGATLAAMRDPAHRTEAKESEAGLPALRSAGLALARTGRADLLLEQLKDRRSKNADIENDNDAVFNAEDLVRGYRIDVFDADARGGARWFSLHQRVVDHTFKPVGGAEAIEPLRLLDEGYLKSTSASSETKEHPIPSDDLYLHETICGWEGWSLSAPRPGKRIVEPGEGDDGESIAHHDPDEGNPFPIVSEVRVEGGTLPRLRVGHTYRVRARTVDLAGNSVAFSEQDLEPPEPDLTLTTEAQRYLRFEPVPSPTLLRRHLDTEGESLEHLVIRSNLGISAADYAELPEVTQALARAAALHSYAEDSQRHLAPPKASEQMAEQHGRLEDAFGGTPDDMTTALRIALREEGTFLDETIVDIATGQKTVAQSAISLFPPSAALPAQRGAPLGQGAYAYYPDPTVVLPFLPDPLAVGVSLTGYDFTDAEVFHARARFPGGWPELAPLRLRLSEGPLSAEFVGGVLEVRLPKAEVVWARLSSVLEDGRLEDLAIWQWIPPPDRTTDLLRAALQGRHWMLTPFRRVTLTHAVQQPLVVPDMTQVVSSRSLGDTFAVFRGAIANHAKSTGRLDVLGEWTEDVDLVTDDEPRMRAFGSELHYRAQAFGFEIRRSHDQAEVHSHGARHEFGDTKYRRIVYNSVATTRFREFLSPGLTEPLTNIQRVEQTADPGGTLKAGLEHHIPSSARPAAPEVLYALPTFRWVRNDDGPQRRHVRHGKAVRVWLRRPWFSSGDGEQLGVVLQPGIPLPKGWQRAPGIELAAAHTAGDAMQISAQPLRRSIGSPGGGAQFVDLAAVIEAALDLGAPPPTDEQAKRMLKPYVTAWGSDPVWKSALPELPPTVAAFPLHSGYAGGLTLEELPPQLTVVVAAHDVHFDRGRKLWYCDIEIDAGDSYYPFVRLALARYQAHSVPGSHLSRVVMTDFIQLAPDRAAEVSLSADRAHVAVSGFSGRNKVADMTAAAALPGVEGIIAKPSSASTTLRVALERRVPGVPGDLGWERAGSDVTLAPIHSKAGVFAVPKGPFHVTWRGEVPLPGDALESGNFRLLITESETYLRDYPIPGDPNFATSPADFVRERVVYADTFEI